MFLNTAVWIKVMLAILVAFVVSIALTPFVKRLAVKVGAVDVPGEARRVHDHPIPRMGGLAIFLGFIVSTLLFADITQEVRGILIGSIIIVITGVIDDIVSLRAWTKFLIQILAAVIAVLHGVVINVVSNPNVFSNQEAIVLGWVAIPLTVLWIVGITNSVNLIDGLDGLAVGVSTISCVTILVVALLVSEPNVALIVAALAGACIGFMPYNLNPARIFMGDTGSLLLGYVQDMDTTKSREVMQNFAKVVKVPQSRFYTAIEQKSGKTGEEAGGYAKAEGGKDINFMILHKPALIQFSKHIAPKIIEPGANQDGDAYKFGYRQVAIADVYKNKVAGIYLHHKAT